MASAIDPDHVDLVRLAAWMDAEDIAAGLPIAEAQPLGGGTQNTLVRFRRGARDLVLRRPTGSRSDRFILREARVLEALHATAVPHPGFVARCDDRSVIGVGFYIMDAVDGCNPTVDAPPALVDDLGHQRHLANDLVHALLTLGRVKPDDVGLSDLGNPQGWAARQTGRWWSQLASYDTWRGGGDELLPGVTDLRDWLDAHTPGDVQIGLIHGDVHLANVMVDPLDGSIAALVDWELATQADPLVDLGHLLATWPTVGGKAAIDLASPLRGLPNVDMMIDRYADGADRDLTNLTWFRALASYRLAIILQGGWSRSLNGDEPPEIGARARDRSVSLIGQALELVHS